MKLKIKLNRGFTLLEVLIAVVILASGIVVVTSSWSGNFLRIRKTNLYFNVASLLERKMTEIQAQYYGKPVSEMADDDGDFGPDFPQYRWSFKVKDFEMPDLSAMILGEQGRTDQTMLMLVQQTTEFLSQSIKEGTVSVFVRAGKNETEYKLTAYFIDYNKDISLPGAPGATPSAGGR